MGRSSTIFEKVMGKESNFNELVSSIKTQVKHKIVCPSSGPTRNLLIKVIPQLISLSEDLYENESNIKVKNPKNDLHKCFKGLASALRCLQRDYRLTKMPNKNEFNDKVGMATREFLENLKSTTQWNVDKWQKGSPSPTIDNIDSLLRFIENHIKNIRGFRKTEGGHPPHLFNIVLFHAITKLTRFKEEKDGRIKAHKDWDLIIYVILWLYNYLGFYDEIKEFINAYGELQASEACQILRQKFQKNYNNFLRSNKGIGRFTNYFEDGSEWIGFYKVILTPTGYRIVLV